MNEITRNDGMLFKFNGLITKNFDGNFLSDQRGMHITTVAVYFICPNSPENDDGKLCGNEHEKL